jgi:hypothetical protein
MWVPETAEAKSMSHNGISDNHPDSPAAGATTPLGSPPAPTRTGRPADDLAEHHAPGQDAGPPQPLHAWTRVLDAITPARIRGGIAVAVLVALVVSALAYGLYWRQFHGALSDKQEAWGQFGDFVGGVINPVVGLLTVFGLAGTVLLQVGQLALSRQALHEAQQEVRAAATERAETAKLMARQLELAEAAARHQKELANATMVATEFQVMAHALEAVTEQSVLLAGNFKKAGGLVWTENEEEEILRRRLEETDRYRARLGDAIMQAASEMLSRRAAHTHAASN